MNISALFRTFLPQLSGRVSFSNVKSRSNLNSLLLNMPKAAVPKTAEPLQKAKSQLKEKGTKYSPGTVTLKVLGSGAKGAPRSLYVFTDQSRYLFNCGEGTQRLAHEHKMRLSKLEQIFVTYPSWDNIGGLPGIALTIQDVGVKEITLHGPDGLDEIFEATKKFVVLKNLSAKMAACNKATPFNDPVMTVSYIPISAATDVSSETDSKLTDSEDESKEPEMKRSRLDAESDEPDIKRGCFERNPNESNWKRGRFEAKADVAMCYACRVHDRPPSLSLEACVERGVPAGPLLGLLKAGRDVTLPNGTAVRASDVCRPAEPGPVFLVVDCPTVRHLDALLDSPAWAQLTSANLLVHFTPLVVMRDPRYVEWMESFSPSTQHLVLNDGNSCLGSVAVHRIQHQLNLLHAGVFPLLEPSEPSQTLEALQDRLQLVEGRTLTCFHLRPLKGLDRSEELCVTPQQYVTETLAAPLFPEALAALQGSLAEENRGAEYPHVVFLGTGSCIPNKTRNTSGILLCISAEVSMLLDCGEGTYGQLVRLYGPHVDEVLRKIRAVYVSHLHADHHIGLVGLVRARQKAGHDEPLLLIAPKQIKYWLDFYHRRFEAVMRHLSLVHCGALYTDDHKLPAETERSLLARLELSDISTVLVNHCPNAFGVAFTHRDWKISYSGDTTPCKEFVALGLGSDLLIHEATMEDDLETEARLKLHSTTSQAVAVGRDMAARFTLLTHFSQRYAKLPRLDEALLRHGNVGIAFDNMKVSLAQLSSLPLLYPALKIMFASHHEELEVKAERRKMKKERQSL